MRIGFKMVHQRELRWRFAGQGRLFVIRHWLVRRRGVGRDQRNQTNIGANADPLQHHAADSSGNLDRTLRQRALARRFQAGLAEIAKPKRLTRGFGCRNQRAIGGESRDRQFTSLDQPLQPLRQRKRAPGGFEGREKDTAAAIVEFKPRARAGHQRAERRRRC